MLRNLTLAALLLLAPSAHAQISMDDRYEPHAPIVVGCGCEVPEGWEVSVRWRLRSPEGAKADWIAVGNSAHVWAGPGRHTIEMRARLLERTTIVDQDGVEHRVIVGIEDVDDERRFTVGDPPPTPPGPDPGPGPGPDPAPTEFKGKVSAALSAVPAAQRTIHREIGQNYTSIASQAAATPTQWDPALMLAEVRNSHIVTFSGHQNPSQLASAWQSFFVAIGKAMMEEGLQTTDLPGHVALFHAIAEVLQ